jgi:hypothetical protein
MERRFVSIPLEDAEAHFEEAFSWGWRVEALSVVSIERIIGYDEFMALTEQRERAGKPKVWMDGDGHSLWPTVTAVMVRD